MNGEEPLPEGELSGGQYRGDGAAHPSRAEWPHVGPAVRGPARTGAGAGAELGDGDGDGDEAVPGRLAAALMLGLSVLVVVFASLAMWLALT